MPPVEKNNKQRSNITETLLLTNLLMLSFSQLTVAEPGGVGDGASHPSSRILLQGYVYHIYKDCN